MDKGFRQQLAQAFDEYAGVLCGALKKRYDGQLDGDEINGILAEAFVRILDGHGSFDSRKGTLRGYIFTTMCRVAIDTIRAKDHYWSALVDPQSDLWKNVPSQDRSSDCASCSQSQNGLVTALYQVIYEELSPQERAVTLADIKAGGTAGAQTVADSLGIKNVSTVYVIRHKARRKIRLGLKKRGYDFDTPGKE